MLAYAIILTCATLSISTNNAMVLGLNSQKKSGSAIQLIMGKYTDVLNASCTLANAMDDLDRDAILAVLHDEDTIHIDVSNHLTQIPPMDMLPSKFLEATYTGLAGFTATQHLLLNPVINFSEVDQARKAKARFALQTFHFLREAELGRQTEVLHTRGWWDVSWEEVNGKWILRELITTRTVPMDVQGEDPNLHQAARDRVQKGLGRKWKNG